MTPEPGTVDYLSVEDLMAIAVITLGSPQVGDYGLLASAVARPQASAFGTDAYPTLVEKASALLHSLVLNHAFVDGNKRMGWVATRAFLELNGLVLLMPEDDAYDFVISVAEGSCDLAGIQAELGRSTRPLA